MLDQSDLTLGLDLRAANSNKNAILVQTYLSSLRNPLSPVFIETVSLVDTGSTAPAFADEDSLVKKYNITMKKLLAPKPLHLADGLPSGLITQYFTALMTIGHHTESMLFYVTKLSPSTPVILRMPWLRKHNPRPDFTTLGLKFDSDYCAYNCLPWHTSDHDWIAPHGHSTRPTLKYCQPMVEEVPDVGEPVHTANQAEILEDWTMTPRPRKPQTVKKRQETPVPQTTQAHPLNPSRPTRHPVLNQSPYAHSTARVTAKATSAQTEMRAIETFPPQCPTSHPLPARTMQGRRLVSAPPSCPSRTSPAPIPESQTHPNLDDIMCVCAVNFTQFCKQKGMKVMRIHMMELAELVKQEEC